MAQFTEQSRLMQYSFTKTRYSSPSASKHPYTLASNFKKILTRYRYFDLKEALFSLLLPRIFLGLTNHFTAHQWMSFFEKIAVLSNEETKMIELNRYLINYMGLNPHYEALSHIV